MAVKRSYQLCQPRTHDDSSSPLFKELSIIKLFDLVNLHIAIFMFKFHNNLLPTAFSLFFKKIQQVHKYNTRLSAKQSYYIPKARTNYGIFNIRFQGPKVWNDIDEQLKASSLPLLKKVKIITSIEILIRSLFCNSIYDVFSCLMFVYLSVLLRICLVSDH